MTEEELEEQRRLDEYLAGIYDPSQLPADVLREYQQPAQPPVSQWDKFVLDMRNLNRPEGGLEALAIPSPPGVFEDQGQWAKTPVDRYGQPLPLPSGGLPTTAGDYYFMPQPTSQPQLVRNFDQPAYIGNVANMFEQQALAQHWKGITTMAPKPAFQPYHQTSFASVPFQFKLGPSATGKQKNNLYSF